MTTRAKAPAKPSTPPPSAPEVINLAGENEEKGLQASAVTHKKLTDLTPDMRNANLGTQRGSEMIRASLVDYGAGRSLVADKHLRVIGGNKTLEQAGALGMDDIIVVQTTGDKLVVVQRMDLDLETDAKAKELAIADNRAGQVSLNWDPKVLAEFRSEVDLDKFWNKDELVVFFAGTGELKTDEDEVPPTPAEPKTKVGDVYTLGAHRIMCGNALERADVDKLCNGLKPTMVFTDPPYGVSIVAPDVPSGGTAHWAKGLALRTGSVGASKPVTIGGVGSLRTNGRRQEPVPALSRRGHVGTIHQGMKAQPIVKANTYAEIIGDDTTETAIKAYELCAAMKIPVLIFWGGNYYAEALPPSSCWIVWDKENGDSFFADAELAWTNQKTAVRIFKHKWNGLIKASERGEKRVHPTQKPVALAEWCFEKYGQLGDIVLDLFGGSGSTLIACEKTSRRCLMMELSPAYVDVCVDRWEAATGRKAVLHGSI